MQNYLIVSIVKQSTPALNLRNKEFMSESEMGQPDEFVKRIQDTLGLRDYDHFKQFKIDAALGMQDHGDRFTRALGLALTYASDNDAVKIIRVWQSEVTQYELIHRFDAAKKKAEEDELKWATL